MNNQTPQQNQNLKQAQGHASGCKYTVEVKYDEPDQIQKKEQTVSHHDEEISKKQAASQNNEQGNKDEVAETQKPKRPRKTIEQEIEELDAKRQKLIEKKRSQDTHEKIVFGSTVIAMLKNKKVKNDSDSKDICDKIIDFTISEQPKNEEIIKKIISQI